MPNRTALSRAYLVAATLMLGACASPPARPIYSAPALPAPTAGPQDVTVFGVVMLKKFGGIPECSTRLPIIQSDKGAPKLEYTGYGVTAQCYKRTRDFIGEMVPLGSETIFVEWPSGKAPSMAAGNSVVVGLIDGVVNHVLVGTSGVQSQERDYAAIKEKFGNPTVNSVMPQQNRMGAKFDITIASWSLPAGITATFFGAVGTLDHGVFEANSPEWTAREAVQKKKSDANRPSL